MGKSPYSPELRIKIVKECLAGEGSSIELSNKYNIPSSKTIRVWAQKYEQQGMFALVNKK